MTILFVTTAIRIPHSQPFSLDWLQRNKCVLSHVLLDCHLCLGGDVCLYLS